MKADWSFLWMLVRVFRLFLCASFQEDSVRLERFLKERFISSFSLLASSRMISAIASRCFLNFASDSRSQLGFGNCNAVSIAATISGMGVPGMDL